ncbi:hypothetical protein SpiGrapes_3208 [Sphaerochaeta pleomorpha str. Grapes]|uniref:PKD domain-containing protein n=1 Tax=Sphaerochaeta pleomorpha (strain ATCC BAA-1885 / DSM 22778 / Grapes) TaxID=158190 RepID=G8QQM3_SPHPG|nr:NosD domain-containing protein [Sphaerochaeta pleomorpha]AEV30953.1 hypothetical protein SpiGrapes_3208 [Sphaerochaeta pleomorpha str. Grapes]
MRLKPQGPSLPCLFLALISLLSLLLVSCPSEPPGAIEDTAGSDLLTFLPVSSDMEAFIRLYDQRVNDYLFAYVESYNRVVALSNSVFLADLSVTDRALLTSRLDAAIEETDALLDLCREMESYAKNTFEPALEAFRLTETYADYQKEAKTLQAKGEDTWHARRLIEMMLDPEYGTKYSLQDISRRTGVGMSKLFFLLHQTNDHIALNVDIVDEVEYGKEIKYIETVRDTANTVNSTLALVNPVTAIVKGGATATAASAIGWVAKAKTAVTVVENASAVMTFTGNVVNMAVDEKNIPPAFKTATTVNGYLSIVLGGKTGFTGSSSGEKAVAIIGAGNDITTTFFTVQEGGVKVSKTPILETTPSEINIASSESAKAILPSGDYNLPDVEFDSWAYPDFDWGDEQLWEDLYDEVSGLYSQVEAMSNAFDAFAEDWDPTVNTAQTKKEQVDSDSGLPDFLDDVTVVDDPVNDDFSVTLTASPNTGLVPFSVTFSAKPNNAFVPGSMEFIWDFDDGSDLTTASSSVTHEFTADDDYFEVGVRVEDIRGYWATATTRIDVTETLQDIIDYYGEKATIHVPSGTYVGTITIPIGTSLIGAGRESTIIDGRVYLNEDTHLEGFTIKTVASTNNSGIWNVTSNKDYSSMEEFYVEIKDCIIEDGYGLGFDFYPNEVPVTGFIQNNIFRNLESSSVDLDKFDGVFQDNLVTDNFSSVSIGYPMAGAIIKGNTISNTNGTGLSMYLLEGLVTENTISGNTLGVYAGELASESVFSLNTIQSNSEGGMQVQTVKGLVQDNLFSANTISATNSEDGAGLQVEYLEPSGSIQKNTFTGNAILHSSSDGGGLYIFHLKGSVLDNRITNNSNAGQFGYGGGVYISQLFPDGIFTGNTITANNSASIGGGLYIHALGESFAQNTISGNQAKTNGGGVYITTVAYSGFIPSPKVKDSNAISGNTLTNPFNASSKTDLVTPWPDDVLPANPEP